MGVWRQRRAARRAERDRLSGWNPTAGTYDKGGLVPRNPPPAPRVQNDVPFSPDLDLIGWSDIPYGVAKPEQPL